MAGILATIDVEDIGTEKIRAYKDALSDLIPTIASVNAAASGLQGSLGGSIPILGSVATGVRTAATGIAELTAAANPPGGPPMGPLNSGIVELVNRVMQAQQVVEEGADSLRLYIAGLTALAQAAATGGVPLSTMAAAAQELADAAKNGAPGLQQNAAALQEIADRLQQGIPLTAEEARALEDMAKQAAVAAKDLGGVGSAIQSLIADEQQLNAVIKETYQGLVLLSTQLQAGIRVTQLQADALAELAQRAQQGNGFTRAQADELDRLAKSTQAGTVMTKESSQALQRITADYAEANKATLGLRDATEQTTSSMDRFKLAAAAVATVLVLIGGAALGYAKDAAQAAARGEVLGTVLAMVSRNAHLNNAEMQLQVEKIKALGITTDEATTAVIKFIQAQLKVTDAAKLARVAQDLAVVAGINSSQAFERLTHAIEAQSAMMLRSFGIVTSLHTVYGEYAASVGKAVKELDAADKKQAFLNKVLEEGAKFAGTYEAAMSQVGKQFTSLDRLFKEVKDTIGAGLIPIFEQYVRIVNFLTKSFLELDPVLQKATSALLAVGGAMALLGGTLAGAKLLGVLALLEKFPAALTAARLAYGGLAVAANGATVAVGGGGVWAAMVAFLGGPVTATIVSVIAVLGLLTAAFVMLNGKSSESVDVMQKEYAERIRTVDGIELQIKAINKLGTEIAKGAKGAATGDPLLTILQQERVEKYEAAVKSLKDKLGDAQVEFNKTTGVVTIHSEALDQLRRATDAEKDAMVARARAAESEGTKAYQNEIENQKRLQVQIEILKRSHGDMATAMALTREVLKSTDDAIRENTGWWDDLTSIMGNLVTTGTSRLLTFLDTLRKEFVEDAKAVMNVLHWMGRLAEYIVGPFVDNVKKGTLALAKFFPDTFKLVLIALIMGTKDLQKSFHQLAQEMEMGGAAVRGDTVLLMENSKAQIDATKAAEVRLAALKRFANEIDPLTKGTVLKKAAEEARNDAINVLFPSADPAEIAKRKAQIKAASTELYNQLMTGKKQITEAGKVKWVEIEPTEFAKIGDAIEQKVKVMTAAAEAAGKKMANATKSFKDSISDTDPLDMMKFRVAAEELAKSGNNAEEYARKVQKLKPVLDAFAKSNDPKVLGIRELQLALNSLKTDAYEAAIEKGVLANQKLQDSLTDRLEAQVREGVGALFEQQKAMDDRLFQQSLAQSDRVIAVTDAMWERQHLHKMKAVDRELYEEEKRMVGIARAYAREDLLRAKALQAERDAVDRRAELASEEIAIYFNKMNREAEIQLQLQRNRTAAMVAGLPRELAQVELDAAERTRALDQATLAVFQQAQLKEVESHRQKAQAIVGQQEAANAAITQSNKVMFAAQVKDSELAAQRIRDAYNSLLIFGKDAFEGIALAATRGFLQIIDGAKSFKEMLLDIWNSIKLSMFKLFESIVMEWIKSQAKMAAASNAKGGLAGLLGMAGKLLGMGGGSGGANAMAGVGTVVPMPGAGGVGTTTFGGSGTMLAAQGLLAAGAGGFVGSKVGSMFDSRTGGAIGGAASGAATGAMIGALGGPLTALAGAVIGGIAGLVGGMLSGGKEARAVAKAREEYLKAKGGIEEVKKAAAEAGVSIQKMMDTKSAKEFEAELRKIENGIAVTTMQRTFLTINGGLETLSALAKVAGIDLKAALDPGRTAEETAKGIELVSAKLKLIDEAGGLENLRRQAELVGFDLKKAFDATTIEEYNQRVGELNALLEAQQKRLQGLATAATGLSTWLDGFATKMDRGLKDIFPKAEDFKKFEEKLKELRDKGVTLPVNQLDLKGMGLTVEQIKKLNALIAKSQDEFNILGMVATTTFGQVMRETGDLVQAMNAVAPSLDKLIELQEKWGFSADEALGHLLHLRRVIKDNEDIAQSFSGIFQVLDGLGTAGALTQEMFSALGRAASTNYQILIDRGVDANTAMLLAQPTLQKLWEQQQKYGLVVDDTTQKLINQGIEQGIIGQNQKDVNEQILDVMLAIARVLGADLPAAYDAAKKAAGIAGDAAKDAADKAKGGLDGVIDRAKETKRRYDDAAAAARDFGRDAEDAATGAAEGHSPTGLKQVVFRIRESIDLYQILRDKFITQSKDMELAAASVGGSVKAREWLEAHGGGFAGGLNNRGGNWERVEPAPTVTVNVTNQSKADFNTSALDSANMEEAWRSKIQPEFERTLANNTNQLTARIEAEAKRYRTGR